VSHWSQYRHRGRGSSLTPILVSPPAPSDWDFGSDGGFGEVDANNTGPGHGVNGLVAQIYLLSAPEGPFVTVGVNPIPGSNDTEDPLDDVRGCRVAWTIDGAAVSGWSSEKTHDFG